MAATQPASAQVAVRGRIGALYEKLAGGRYESYQLRATRDYDTLESSGQFWFPDRYCSNFGNRERKDRPRHIQAN
jgi:hypothetical protein